MTDVHLVGDADAAEVVLAGWPAAAADAIIAELRQRGITARAGALTNAKVVAFGPELSPEAIVDMLRAVIPSEVEGSPSPRPVGRGSLDCARDDSIAVVLHAGDDLAPFQELVDRDRIFYLAKRPPSLAETVDLLAAATKPYVDDDAEAELDGRVVDLLRRLARESDLDVAIREMTREARIVADASDARMWLYDARAHVVTHDTRRESAAAGLTSFVARTGRAVALDRAGDDPRHDADLDGDAQQRFLALPVMLASRVLAVLVLTRAHNAPSFGDRERQRIEAMVQLLGPALARLILDRELETRAKERHSAIRDDVAQLFRGEALDQYQRGRSDEGHLLELEPKWTRYAYRVIVALAAAALLFALIPALRGFGG